MITLWSLCLPDAIDGELYLSVVALEDNNAAESAESVLNIFACPCWWQTTLEGGTGARLAQEGSIPLHCYRYGSNAKLQHRSLVTLQLDNCTQG